MKRLVGLLAAAALLIAGSSPAFASLRVDPMIITMTPSSAGSSATVEITNVTDIDIPVEISVVRRALVGDQEVLLPAEDDFLVFPPQFVLRPGASQTIRLQWLVGVPPKTSESYYVYATQLPIPLKEGQSGVMLSYRFAISLQMIPNGVAPKLSVLSVDPGSDESGAKGFSFTVQNDGDRFARISEYSMDLAGSAKPNHWSRLELKKSTGVGFMLPGEKRTFFVPYAQDIGASPRITFELSGAQG